MAKAPNWQDSTYQKQISYYNKLAADFAAEEARKKAEVGTYYGTLGTPTTYTYGTYKSYYTKKNGKWVKRKKPANVQLNQYYHDSKGKVKKDKYGNPIKRARKGVLKKGSNPTEGLYMSELRNQRGKDLSDIADDYAARGIMRSGLYAKKLGDYNTEFGKQLDELYRQRSKQYGDIAADRRSFDEENSLQRENARLDAIRRRAALTGQIGL